MTLETGKLPLPLLEEIVAWKGAEDPDVVLGPAVGEDAAAVDLGERYLVLKTDPITFAREEVGWYAVHVNANDVATVGAVPRWFQATLLFPPGTEAEEVRTVGRQIHETCRALGVALTGGHVEVTEAVRHPVVVGDMQGLVDRGNLVTTGGAREGNDLLLAGTAGIEGTALLARARRDTLVAALGEPLVERAAAFHRDPGISVVEAALRAAEMGATSLHDPTEGGVAMGLVELAMASKREVVVHPGAIPVAQETERVCEVTGANPLGLIASGALLATTVPDRTQAVIAGLEEIDVPAAVIGRIGGLGGGVRTVGEGPYPLDPSPRDEVARVLAAEGGNRQAVGRLGDGTL